MAPTLPIAAHDLPASSYPVRFVAFVRDGREIWEETISDPPGIISVPPLARIVGEPVAMRVEYGDGTIEHEYPPGWCG